MSENWIYNCSVFSTDKKHHFESLNNNEMVDSKVLVTRKKLDHLGKENVKDKYYLLSMAGNKTVGSWKYLDLDHNVAQCSSRLTVIEIEMEKPACCKLWVLNS